VTEALDADRKAILADAQAALDDAVRLRRALHSEPELGLVLPLTQARLLDEIDGLGLEVATGRALSSVVAVLEGGQPGPTTLLRADMDALPMPEDTGLDYASRTDGIMHACGHDAHMAMLVGAARLLARRRAKLAGKVVLMFQPGEEGHAGARAMLEEGLLDKVGPVDRGFAVHVITTLPSGVVTTRPGPFMASTNEFLVTVRGRGGHASMPHEALDPVPVACEIVSALQVMVTRRLPVFDPAVVTVARISAGTTSNVIPEKAVLEGTVRAVSETSRNNAVEGVARVAEHVAAAHGCTADVQWPGNPYPVTVNDAAEANRALEVAANLFGRDRSVLSPAPVMGAEDWSYVLAQVPGAMAFLGAAPPGVEQPAPNHSNRMLLDEDAMQAGIALYAAMALMA
jgi:hippurate hydrolase